MKRGLDSAGIVVVMAAVLVATAAVCTPQDSDDKPDHVTGWIEFYDQRYGLDDAFEKGTDNHGEGFDELYGTRNFRTILKGVAYRGGANNTWHRTEPRDNRNPLPDDGLQNLCEEGFGRTYYLYSRNFDGAPREVTCASPRGDSHTLQYFQISSTDELETYEVLEVIYQTIKDYRHGPVYIHCWNGWHASGLLSAKILRQFCGWSADEAVQYWDRNTDGNNRESKYNSIRQRIREFEPYPEFAISQDEAALICP